MTVATGTDWTKILSDPDLVRHVGKLLQAYREAAPEKREEALLTAMREIKAGANADGKIEGSPDAPAEPQPVPTPTSWRTSSVAKMQSAPRPISQQRDHRSRTSLRSA